MKLLTKEIERRLPALYSTENIPFGDKLVVAKFFNPSGAGTWYVVEGSKQEESGDWILFGYAEIQEGEWGYFSLRELENVRGPMGLGIERDILFEPKKFGEIHLPTGG